MTHKPLWSETAKQLLHSINDTTGYAMTLLEHALNQCDDGLEGSDYDLFTISWKLLEAEEQIGCVIRRINLFVATHKEQH